MKTDNSRLYRKIIPAVIAGLMCVAPVSAAEKTDSKTEKSADVPPPAGPYRSTIDVDNANQQNRFAAPPWVQQQRAWMQQQRSPMAQRPDARQWTPPTPPQWAPQQPQVRPPVPPQARSQAQWPQSAQRPGWANRQPPEWVQQQRQQMARPYEPPKWVQEQRKQQSQQPAGKNSTNPAEPPKWVQQRRAEMKKQQDARWNNKNWEVPKWVQERRDQAVKRQQAMQQECVTKMPPQQQRPVFQNRQWTPPAPPQWSQNRALPQQYGAYRGYRRPMPYWGYPPRPQYRR